MLNIHYYHFFRKDMPLVKIFLKGIYVRNHFNRPDFNEHAILVSALFR